MSHSDAQPQGGVAYRADLQRRGAERGTPDGGLRLLIIEDDLVDQKAIARALKKSSLHVACTNVTDVASGLAAVANEQFDCVLLDWNLPDGSGAEFLSQILQVAPTLPVIVLTGTTDEAATEEALAQGAQDYLTKGDLTPNTLARSIRYAMERKRSEQLRARLVQVERLSSISQLAAGVAHEINNPAGWITANIDMLYDLARETPTEGYDEERRAEVVELLEECRAGIDRISDIVRALRVYAEASTTSIERLSLNEAVEQAIRLTRNQIQRVAMCEADLDRSLPRIEGDRSALTQALIHALINAAEAIEAAGRSDAHAHTVFVSTYRVDGFAAVCIEDTGAGLPDDLTRSVFEPFFSTRGERGSGMGLAVVQDVIAQHNGSVRFLPEREGRGARLEIRLPLVEEADSAQVTPLTVEDGGFGVPTVEIGFESTAEYEPSLHLLVVNDEPTAQKQLRVALDDDAIAYKLVTSASAVMSLLHEPFDAVIVNLARIQTMAVPLLDVIERRAPLLLDRVHICHSERLSARTRQQVLRYGAHLTDGDFTEELFTEILADVDV